MNQTKLAGQLETRAAEIPSLSIVAGFDAFVDEIIHVVGRRHSPGEYAPVPTIAEFGEWVAASSGKSGLREFVTLERTAGGCTVNQGDGIATLGFPLHAFAGVGDPPDPVFESFLAKCASNHSLEMQPGRAVAYEFQDGKLIFCSFSHFSDFTPAHLKKVFANGVYRRACEQASALVFTTWSVYPFMTDCWKFLQNEVLSGLPNRPQIFIDLADPASRSPEDLLNMTNALSGFEKIGPTTLSLNGNEGNRLAAALNLSPATEDSSDTERLCEELRTRAQISRMGIHLVKSASSASQQGTFSVPGPYCAKPVKSVGAGDRFNAGWLAGLTLQFDPSDSLLLGVASSGFFVRNGRSGTLAEIIQFLRNWE